MRLKIYAWYVRGDYKSHIAERTGLHKKTVAAVIDAMAKRALAKEQQQHVLDPAELWQSVIKPGWRVHGEVRRLHSVRACDR